MKLKQSLVLLALLTTILYLPSSVLAQEKKANILVIFGDDIGQTNVSAYSMGVMGYKTPKIDRLAKEGAGGGAIVNSASTSHHSLSVRLL